MTESAEYMANFYVEVSSLQILIGKHIPGCNTPRFAAYLQDGCQSAAGGVFDVVGRTVS